MVCLHDCVPSGAPSRPCREGFLPGAGKCKCTNDLRAAGKRPSCVFATVQVQEIAMYAVIRAGGKQYRVAPGDVIEVEKLPQESGAEVQFGEVLAVSANEGELTKPANAVVTGQVV